MKFTEDYLIKARQVIVNVYKDLRPELLKHYGEVDHELKEDQSVVTKIDLWAEDKITQALTAFDPGVGIWGEERGQSGNKDTFWLIDPIDGTESFIRGIPNPRNMVTLVENNEPIFTTVYKFVTDELYEATKGKGALRSGERIKISERPLERAWLDVSIDLSDPVALKAFLEVRKHIAGYSIMRDFLYIAEGKIEGGIWWQTAGGPWDYAPRGLLFSEAGARVSNIGSDHYDYRKGSYLVAAPQYFDTLHNVILSCIPDTKTVQ